MKKIVSIFITGICLVSIANAKTEKAPRISALKILESYTLPTTEISGMAWRKNPETKKQELIVVSDREHKIFLVDWSARKKKFEFKEIDVAPLEKAAGADPQSGWESVFSDDSGRVFLIQENPTLMLVLSSDLKKIETKIALTVPKDAAKKIEWDVEPNAGGEGFIPLKNGHVLVVKEKNPLRIVEFAPGTSKAEGYSASLSIEHTGSFPIPKGPESVLNHVFTWRFSEELETLFEDASGLNADHKGMLYLLGDQRNLIGRIGKTLKTGKEKIKMSKLWSIPSDLRQPEGMVIDEDQHPIIAIDQKKANKPNLFILSPLL